MSRAPTFITILLILPLGLTASLESASRTSAHQTISNLPDASGVASNGSNQRDRFCDRNPHMRIDPTLDEIFFDLIERSDLEERHTVLVAFHDDSGAARDRFMQDLNLTSDRIAEDAPADLLIVELTAEEYMKARGRTDLLGMELHRILVPLLHNTTQLIGAVDTWAIEIDGISLDGTGQTIAILDTGIDWSHPAFAGKNALGGTVGVYCTNFGCEVMDPPPIVSVHGTKVAGVAGANGSVEGVAKGAKFINLMVFNESVKTSPLRASKGIEWVVENADEYNISVIVTAMGSTGGLFYHHCDQTFLFTFTPAIEKARANGITVTAAAGNWGASNPDKITMPACITSAIPVSNSTKQDAYWPSTNYNELVNLFAPGVSISTTCFNGTSCLGSGTSYSSPHLGGAVAILNQLNQLLGNPPRSLDPKDFIHPLLHETGDPVMNLPYGDATRINIYNAVQAMLEMDWTISGDLNGDGVEDIQDVLKLISAWGPCADCDDCLADLDNTCAVGIFDLLILLTNWG